MINLKKVAENATQKKLEEVGIDLSKYEKSEEGFLAFIRDWQKIARNRELALEKKRLLNRYPEYLGIVGNYFGTPDFVGLFHRKFWEIIDQKTPVPFDTNGYRFEITQGWSEKYRRFTYAGQFAFVIDVVLDVLAREESVK